MSKTKIGFQIVYPIAYLVVGILFLMFRATALEWIFTFIGIFLILEGVLSILGITYRLKVSRYRVVEILYIVAGVSLILGGWLLGKIILTVFGILVIIDGLLSLNTIIKFKSTRQIINTIMKFVIGILLIICNDQMLNIILIIVGILYMLKGIYGLLHQTA